ncbi:AAA family ATPase [Williamsia sterculiae]
MFTPTAASTSEPTQRPDHGEAPTGWGRHGGPAGPGQPWRPGAQPTEPPFTPLTPREQDRPTGASAGHEQRTDPPPPMQRPWEQSATAAGPETRPPFGGPPPGQPPQHRPPQPPTGETQQNGPFQGTPQQGRPQQGQPQGPPHQGAPQPGRPPYGQPTFAPQSGHPGPGAPQPGQPRAGQPQSGQHVTGSQRPAGDPWGQPGGFGHDQSGPPPSLDEVALLRKARRAPASGWRRAVHRMSAGTINPGDSPDDLYYQQLLERVNRPVRGDYRIAVLSLKGGVGKTTTTVGLGSTFAALRGDRVIAVDANPDLGTLAQRIPQQTRSTVRDLLADTSIYRYSDVRAHTSQAPSRLEVLASERDPAVAEAFSADDYRGVMAVLQRFYNIIITDCGTGLSHSAMNGVLDFADALILVSSPAIDGARSAGATLDWLQAHGYAHLVSRAVVVLSSSRPGSSTIDTNQLAQHFLTRCRAVQSIPFDDHLSEGAEVDLELLSRDARRAFVELAAVVADDFTTSSRREEPFQP